jgi:hypothetical protein
MKCVYDKNTDAVYINVEALCSYVYRGGDIDARFVPGNKNGQSIVSHKLHTSKPNIVDAYTFTTISDGIKITVYTYPENVKKADHGYSAVVDHYRWCVETSARIADLYHLRWSILPQIRHLVNSFLYIFIYKS